MKKQLFLIGFIFLSCVGYSQNGINKDLKIELDSIMKSDQILREFVDSETSEDRKKEILKEVGRENDPSFRKNIWSAINKQDSINLIKIEKIIAVYGYPGKSLVGEPTNESAWFVIQHSSKIANYLPMIEEAAKKGEIPFTKYAMMQDRYLTQQGKEQIYGTQGQGKQVTNKETGKKEFFNYISPIENPEKVNELRKKAGFTSTVEENAKRMGIEYKVYTLDEIAKIN
ncbi:DUF6624 domain-containing protein [Flavobacterium sp. LAR06]|uniref:DUF6624 domain-containing protein n=1 Tax=Flavobacterium sp. LAR06 TaxID=3064897 RepID=UPI0035C1FEBF